MGLVIMHRFFVLCINIRYLLQDYKTKCVDTAIKCGKAAAEAGVKKFIEVSTAQVYSPDKVLYMYSTYIIFYYNRYI
jgi:hypothetical protein